MFLLFVGCDDEGGGGQTPTPDSGMADAGPVDQGPDADAAPADQGPMGTGILTVLPVVLDLGTVGIGLRNERDLVLGNVGDGDLTITAFEGLELGFSVSRQPPLRIPAGQERTLVVQFAPQAEGRVEATLRLVTDIPGEEPAEVVLRGVGGNPSGELEADVLDLGEVAPGEQTADFIRVRNTSEGIPLTVFGVAGLEAPYSIPDGQLPASAEVGQSATVLVQFAPEGEGDFEQMVVVQTDAGDFPMTIRGRALAVGDLVVRGVEPAWGPTDADVPVTIHGGPFGAVPDRVLIGGVELTDLERVDPSQIRGVLPAGGEATGTDADAVDVRVEVGAAFGVATRAFVRTGPVAAGRALDAAAVAAGTVGPEGNPWRLDVDAVPEGQELVIAPATVILCDGRTLTAAGVLRAGGEGGPVVFSASEPAAGRWGGLRFPAAPTASSLADVVVEFAGAEGGPALQTAQAAAFSALKVRRAGGVGIEVLSGGTLVLLGGQITDVAGDAIQLLASDGGWFRFSDTWIRRAQWPVAAAPNHFRQPLGPGHDWAGNAHEGIGIGGTVEGMATLGAQPAPLVYRLREPLQVAMGATLTLGAGAPLRLDGLIEVAGRLALPGGLRLQASAGGRLDIQGALAATGTPADPVTIEARAAGEGARPGAWGGIVVRTGADFEVTRLILRDAGENGPALDFEGAAGMINGLEITDSSSAALRLDGVAQISSLALRGNMAGIVVTGGAGRLEGVVDDVPAIEFADLALCGGWNLEALVNSDGASIAPICE
ncbi:MAG: choice-of-anchor D domain-containing protein [Myxococcales bacterium]|nr:choice-of-anchor D domain-containing protein [Myxococcales bacterium]